MRCAIYDTTTGEILRIYDGSEPDLQIQDGEGYVEASNGETDEGYMVNPVTDELTEKPAIVATISKTSVIANGIDFILVGLVPLGATVAVWASSGEVYGSWVINDGDASLTFDTQGDYLVTVHHPLMMPQEFNINAV